VLAMLAVFRTFPSSVQQWVGALAVGLLGGWLGGWLTSALGLEEASWVGSLVIAFAGAYLLLLALRKAQPDRDG
jgi:uncharacterized membrane protein YeaQ/YmgE (transglycosylase-associated protein family)